MFLALQEIGTWLWQLVTERTEVLALALNVAAITFLAIQIGGEKSARRLDSTLVLFQLLDGHWRRYRNASYGASSGDHNAGEFEHGQLLAAIELVALTINRSMVDGPVSGFYRDYLRDVLGALTSTDEDHERVANLVTSDEVFSEIRKFLKSEPPALEYRRTALNAFSGVHVTQLYAEPRICLIVARGRNGVIGAQGDMPWRLSSDLKHFKAITGGKPIIMGRKTWDSLPRRPLPGRLNIVVTRQTEFVAEGAQVVGDLDAAFEIATRQAQSDSVGEVFVIGGAQIYAAALTRTDRLYITEVDAEPAGDVVFPALAEADWNEASCVLHAAGPGDDHACIYRVLERV